MLWTSRKKKLIHTSTCLPSLQTGNSLTLVYIDVKHALKRDGILTKETLQIKANASHQLPIMQSANKRGTHSILLRQQKSHTIY